MKQKMWKRVKNNQDKKYQILFELQTQLYTFLKGGRVLIKRLSSAPESMFRNNAFYVEQYFRKQKKTRIFLDSSKDFN